MLNSPLSRPARTASMGEPLARSLSASIATGEASTAVTPPISTSRRTPCWRIGGQLPPGINNPLAFNPGALMDPLASSFELFSFWTILLPATGLKAAAGKKLSFGGALFSVLLPWAVVVLYVLNDRAEHTSVSEWRYLCLCVFI